MINTNSHKHRKQLWTIVEIQTNGRPMTKQRQFYGTIRECRNSAMRGRSLYNAGLLILDTRDCIVNHYHSPTQWWSDTWVTAGDQRRSLSWVDLYNTMTLDLSVAWVVHHDH